MFMIKLLLTANYLLYPYIFIHLSITGINIRNNNYASVTYMQFYVNLSLNAQLKKFLSLRIAGTRGAFIFIYLFIFWTS